MSAYALRPSAASVWGECPGSVPLSAPFPEDEGPEAREGTAAHWVATEYVRTGLLAQVGETAPNGERVTQEMIDGAALFFAAVAQRMPTGHCLIEQPVHCFEIHPENGGTPDVHGMGHEQWVLHVIDYKYGHAFIEVFENLQCVDYVSGIFSEMIARGQVAASAEPHITVEITIVQPRSYHRDGPVRSWRVRLDQLRPLFNKLYNAAHEATGPSPRTIPGSHCEFCAARHVCTSLQNASYRVVDYAGTASAFDLSAHETGQELRWLHAAQKMLAARISGLEVQATAMIRRGERVPHYALQPTWGRLTWKEGVKEQAIAVCALLGKDITKPIDTITPLQAQALGIDEAVINQYAHRPRGETKLTPQDDTATRKIFGDSTNG